MTDSSPTSPIELSSSYPLRFPDRDSLAQLPWFDIDRGELIVSDKSVGPIIDVHTHYALPSARLSQAEMERETPDSNLLLGRCCPHHLDTYANSNFSCAELDAMKRELTLGALRKRTKRVDHTAPNMARDMRSMGVERTIVIGIDMGVISRHVKLTLDIARHRDDHVGFGSVHPRLPGRRERFDEQLALGSRGVKIHPPNMFTRPDHPRAVEIYEWCGKANIPVFFHCGPAGIEPKAGADRAQVRFYDEPIRRNPKTRFVLGHAGARQSSEAIEIYRRYPNVWMDISSLSIFQLKELLEKGNPDRIMFGSDWPFYHPILPLAKVLMLTEGNPKLRHKVLYENAARFIDSIGKPLSA